MAYSAIESNLLGLTLQINYNKGYITQINEDVDEFNSLEAFQIKEGAVSLKTNFLIQTAIARSNVQFVDPGAQDGAFISGGSATIAEKSALMKEINSVIEVQQPVWERAAKAPMDERYIQPIMLEQHNVQVAQKQYLSVVYYGDGSGALAELDGTGTISGGAVALDIYNQEGKKGFVHWPEIGEKVNFFSTAGAAVDPGVASGTVSYCVVTAKDETLSAPSVTVKAYDASDNLLTINSIAALVDGTLMYKAGQESYAIPDISGSVSDWGDLSVVMPGLESISAADGRTVHGITMSGLTAGTHSDLNSASLYFTDIANLLTKLKRANGESTYDYPTFKCAPEVFDYLMDINEGQRFLQMADSPRGGKEIVYTHRNTVSKLVASRYCPSYRAYFEPKAKAVQGNVDRNKLAPLQFRFTNFDYIRLPDGRFWDWKHSASGRVKAVQMHMQGFGTFMSTRPSSIGVLKDFAIS